MKRMILPSLILIIVVIVSCNEGQNVSGGKTITAIDSIFPTGSQVANDNFIGAVWLQDLIVADSISDLSVGNVTFEPGSRTKWHIHPAGQILLATSGVGFSQEKGGQKKVLRKGDVIKCPPNVPHWHGASSDTAFIQIAITSRAKGPTKWLNAVTDKEYNANTGE